MYTGSAARPRRQLWYWTSIRLVQVREQHVQRTRSRIVDYLLSYLKDTVTADEITGYERTMGMRMWAGG